MDIEQVIEWIVTNPHLYPGKQNTPQPRSTSACKPLEPQAQMFIIWRSLCEYLKENLSAGRGVNIRGFGAFTFDIHTELPKLATRAINPFDTLRDQRMERKHVHKAKPVFVVDPSLKILLTHY